MSRYRMSTKICLRYTSSESSAVMKSRNHEKIILHSPGWGLTFSLISFQLKTKLNNLSPKNKREISFMFPLYHSTLTTPLIPVLAHQTSNYLKVKHFPIKAGRENPGDSGEVLQLSEVAVTRRLARCGIVTWSPNITSCNTSQHRQYHRRGHRSAQRWRWLWYLRWKQHSATYLRQWSHETMD